MKCEDVEPQVLRDAANPRLSGKSYLHEKLRGNVLASLNFLRSDHNFWAAGGPSEIEC